MELFYTSERAEWRKYLAEHFETQAEVWLVFPTKASGEKGLSYNDAVEEALCFGWIDGRAGTLDDTHHIRRFTPRRKGSPYSRPNIERLIRMEACGMIHPAVRESVLPVISEPFVFPPDILDALREDEAVWENWQRFSEPYRRIRVAYIDAARKRPEEFRKRLKNFMEKTRAGKLITGYGGIEKYYRRAFEIRKCREEDIARIGQFYDSVVLWLNDHVNYPRWIYRVYPSESSVRAMAEAGAQYVCLDGEAVAGAFALNDEPQGSYRKGQWSRDLPDGSYMVLHALAIDPALQGQGAGSEIIGFCIDRAREEGYQAVRVDIVPTNVPARRLFEKNGFRYVGDVDLELGIGNIPAFSLYEYDL